MDIKNIKGIGDKTAALFAKLNVFTTEDLIRFFPRNYDHFEKPILIDDIDGKITVAIKGTVVRKPSVMPGKRLNILSTIIQDPFNTCLKLVWFNMPYLRAKLQPGTTYVFRGRIAHKGNEIRMEQPEIFTLSQYESVLDAMQPIYSLTKGLSNKTVVKAIHSLLDNLDDMQDILPENVRREYGLISSDQAFRQIHFPKTGDYLYAARKRLAFDEFVEFIYVLKYFKQGNKNLSNKYIITNNPKTDEFLKSLPFELTNAQKNVWEEIKSNMSGNEKMNRLIQGDVGSGKTIVAVLALINTALNGYQGAMMAPTEVLAIQHYEYFCELIEQYNLPMKVAILTGSMTASQKRETYKNIENGYYNIIIGTHALIQENVKYKALALAITDEQHRFGVRQREMLSEKGLNPHILVMSATPIPRTLAIILYGDLDISIINELPKNRMPIKNCVVDINYRPNAYKFIENEIKKGHQAYIICPMVEESDNFEAENVVDYCDKLKNIYSSDIKIQYLHGKMKAQEKNSIMEKFAEGEIQILISTTVIEVGINVPNATVIMIEDAQRFGLASLHQLRGRVGRGSSQSYCILVNTSKSDEAKKRLDILNKSNDGFYIASEDMKMRGPGDFFGLRQSGQMDFKMADIYTDAEILKNASDFISRLENDTINMRDKDLEYFHNEMQKSVKKAVSQINL